MPSYIKVYGNLAFGEDFSPSRWWASSPTAFGSNTNPCAFHALCRFETNRQKERRTLKCPSFFLVTRTGIEPMFPAWEASVLTAWPTGRFSQLCYYTTKLFKMQYLFAKKLKKFFLPLFFLILIKIFYFFDWNIMDFPSFVCYNMLSIIIYI